VLRFAGMSRAKCFQCRGTRCITYFRVLPYSRRSRFGVIAAESPLRYRLRTDNAHHKHGDDMAAILVLGGIKGGIGKSTIASNLSVLAARGGH
jgi:Mrp family chromosome partitioning ATPase